MLVTDVWKVDVGDNFVILEIDSRVKKGKGHHHNDFVTNILKLSTT